MSRLLVFLLIICSQYGPSVSQGATPTELVAHGTAQAGPARATAKACICHYVKQGTLSHPVDSPLCALENVNRLWNQTYPPLPKRALAFKKVILSLAESNVPRWLNVATAVSGWFWSSVGQIEAKPNFCGFTQVINSTYSEEIDCEGLKCGLNTLSDTVMDATRYITATSLKNAGCPKGSIVPTSSIPSCYADGAVYPINEFWRKYGPYFPCSYETTVKHLYTSKLYINKLLAAIATSGASEAMSNHYKSFNKMMTFTALKLLTPAKLPECCCPQLELELCNSMKSARGSADYSTKMTLEGVGCPT